MIIDSTAVLLAAIPFVLIGLYVHRRLNAELFEKVLVLKDVSTVRLVLACLSINFTLFSLAYLLPLAQFLQMIMGSYYPIISITRYPTPSTYEELYRTQPWFTFVLPIIPGPSLIFVLRWFRQNGKRRGRGLLKAMSGLLFVSIILAILSAVAGSGSSHASLQTYWIALMAALIPGTIGISGVLLWLMGFHKTRFHFLSD